MPGDLAAFRYLAHLERVVLTRGVRRTGTAEPGRRERFARPLRYRFTSPASPMALSGVNGHVTRGRPATARSEESHEA